MAVTNPFPRVTDFFLLGKTLKSHGTAGQMRIAVEDRFQQYIQSGTYIFFDLDGSKVPYQIASTDDGAHLVISLQGVDTKEQADSFAGLSFWLNLTDVLPKHLKSPKNRRDDWTRYQIYDTVSAQSFSILRTEEFPQQLMAVIVHDDRERYIPLSDHLITSIDQQEKLITMEFPEGLLEI